MFNKTEFKQLFDKHFDAIRSFVLYRCGDADVASDIAQNVFMKVWEKRDQLNKDNLKSLLYKIANDMVISDYRKGVSRTDFKKSIVYHDEHLSSPEDELVFKELSSTYAKALDRMPEAQRVVFLMSRNDDLKYREIADYLGVSVKAIEKRMSAALQFLRTELL